MTLFRRAVADGLGTAFLLATVIGSGIMGETLAQGNVAVALLANTLATGAGLVALIMAFAPLSGAHFNPLVTLVEAARGGLPWRETPAYVAAQIAGALLGAVMAHAMFGKPLLLASTHIRSGLPQAWAEFVATFGLVFVILAVSRNRPPSVPFAVGAYITAAYWFTASTSFANPAVTLARSMTDTFSGIRPADAPGFIIGQALGALGAYFVGRWFGLCERGNVQVQAT